MPERATQPNMRAAVLDSGDTLPELREIRRPEPGPSEVLVRVVRAGFNRLDRMIAADPTRNRPTVLGADAAGVVADVGRQVERPRVGDDVVIDPGLRWGASDAAPQPSFEILGDGTSGTHAEYVVVPAENVHPKPQNLTWDEAAGLPLAGVTAWRALVTRGRVGNGERVLITGAGGGVATFLVQLALARGARVAVTSGSQRKLDLMAELGAQAGVLHTDEGWPRALAGSFGPVDLAIDSSGLWSPVLDTLRPGGRLVTLGRSRQTLAQVDVHQVFWQQVSVIGSSMGSPRDFSELLHHVQRARWRPVIDSVWRFDQYLEATQRVDDPHRIGKVVIAMSDDAAH